MPKHEGRISEDHVSGDDCFKHSTTDGYDLLPNPENFYSSVKTSHKIFQKPFHFITLIYRDSRQ